MTKKYKKWMTHYKRLAKPFEKRTPEDKAAMLISSIGENAALMYDSTSEVSGSGDALAKAEAWLELLFTVPKVEAKARVRFFATGPASADEKPLVLLQKLREASVLCNFTSADEEIMRMMLSRCPDTMFQEKRMLAGWDHTKLEEAKAFARNIEQSHLLQKRIKSSYGNHSRVNKITAHMQCRNCGRSHGQICPAKNQKCHFCKKIGHFKAQCLKLKSLGYGRGRGQAARGSRSRGGRGGRGNRGRGNFGNSFRGNARGQSHSRRGRGGYRVGSV